MLERPIDLAEKHHAAADRWTELHVGQQPQIWFSFQNARLDRA